MVHATENMKQQMAGLNKAELFLHENAHWKRLLVLFINENNFFKTRLSEVVDMQTDKTFIAQAEQFQNEFLLKDDFIRDIGKDIKEQEEYLQLACNDTIAPTIKISKKQEKLRNEMCYLEKESATLKNRFNKYLLTYNG